MSHLVKEVNPFSHFSWTHRACSDLKSLLFLLPYQRSAIFLGVIITWFLQSPLTFRNFNYTYERSHSLCWKNLTCCQCLSLLKILKRTCLALSFRWKVTIFFSLSCTAFHLFLLKSVLFASDYFLRFLRSFWILSILSIPFSSN